MADTSTSATTSTNKTVETFLLVAQVGAQLIPIVTLTVGALKALLAEHDVDPAIYQRIEAAYADRIAQSEQEAATHGHPVDPSSPA